MVYAKNNEMKTFVGDLSASLQILDTETKM